MNDEVKQFLVQKYYDQWYKDNKEFADSLDDLCASVVLFNAMWGTKYTLTMEGTK